MSFIHGFRVSEVCRLRLSDMDLGAKILYIQQMNNRLSTNHPLV
ncbi:tyrosine-type recombinase/integrase [Serratia bockelmannii]